MHPTMGSTLLIGTSKTTWRGWLKARLSGRDLVCLDPADANHGTPARIGLYRGERCVGWRFVGSTDAARNPIAMLSGAARLLAEAGPEPVVQMFDYRHQPVVRQLAYALAQVVQPAEILIPRDAGVPTTGWPVGPVEIEPEAEFQPMVVGAQRHAQWLKLLESCQDHEVGMDEVAIEGARFGSGERVKGEALQSARIEGLLHAEVCAGHLLMVVRREPDEDQVLAALNLVHANKATVVQPQAFSGRLCSFARQSGEDFGMGVIEEADFAARTFRVRCTAIAPAPVRILRIGTLKVDSLGREQGDDRPWTV